MAVPIAVGLATVYALSFLGKRKDRRRVEHYLRPIAGRRTRVLARTVIMFEAVLSVALLMAAVFPPVAPWLGAASGLFVVSATAFHAALMAKGQSARCQCFGDMQSPGGDVDDAWRPALLWLRNAPLVCVSAALADVAPSVLIGTSFGVAGIIAAGLVISIIGEHAHLRRDTHPLTQSLRATDRRSPSAPLVGERPPPRSLTR